MSLRLIAAGVLVAALGVAAADPSLPRILYSKSFPGSTPAFTSITVARDGHSEYREAPDEEPLAFRLSEKESADIFALAEKLERFKRPLEAKLKVAFTGAKTFRYEHGNEKNEVKFNFSLDPDARLLWDWFERISETERHRINLERAVRFDKLGVNQALLELEVSRDRARLVAVEQFLPLLDRIIKNQSLLHMARERAARLADGFRDPGAASQ